jgi:hydroxymethylglutaryl-CoA synthase
MQRAIGIDCIGAYVPRLYIDLTGEWANTRAPLWSDGEVHKLVGKVTEGVGVTRMAVTDAHQDCATLAAMAAKRAIDAAGIDPRDIDYLAVGTETTVDQSKSTAAYVLGMLERHYGVSMACAGAPQFQFACIGATYALEAAISRIRAGDHAKPYSMVIASDISRYPLCTPGEYTQGAGAVALLISENPRLIEIERGLTGTITRDERDFFRPNWSSTAVVDGKYSVDVYMDCVEAAFSAFAGRLARQLRTEESAVLDAIDYLLFHVPFPRMAEYAAARILATQWLASGDAGLVEAVPSAALRPTGDERSWRKEVEKALAKSALFRTTYARKVTPSLSLSRDVGNIYSGSLYLALASLLEHCRDESRSLAGKRAVFASYGSGASAKVFSGLFADRCAEIAAQLHVGSDLLPEAEGGKRVALSVSEYERLHGLVDCELNAESDVLQKLRDGVGLAPLEVASLRAAWTKPSWRVASRGASVRPPRGEFALERIGTDQSPQRTDVGYRYYTWVPES